MSKFRVVAIVIMGAAFLIPYPGKMSGQRPDLDQLLKSNKIGPVKEKHSGKLPLPDAKPSSGALPAWFKELDRDGDGQIDLFEWFHGGKEIGEFRKFDLNGDGLITADEVLRCLKKRLDLELENGQVHYQGTLEEAAAEEYRDKKSFKVFSIKLEQGVTYQIDLTSKAFDAFLYLENAEGTLLAEDDDGGEGLNARIVFRPDRTGTYRIIATSAGDFRPGAYSLSVRVVERSGSNLPMGLPPWFKELDKDKDGQIALHEWLQGGKELHEFREYDLNGDGLITPEEVLRCLNKRLDRQAEDGGNLPTGLPAWFKDLDKDGDGQISLREWLQGGKEQAEFHEYDLNGDGLITPAEVLRHLQKRLDLELENGQSSFEGVIEQAAKEHYRGKKCFKIFTIRLEQGTTYQIDHMSKAFDAYLYLEDADGTLLAENDDGGEGLNSRIIFRAEKTGPYRLIATSVGDSRPGAFSFSVRVLERFGGNLPRGLPSWFEALDRDRDGQITLREWLQGGKELREFREYDLNGDGLLTPDEVLRFLKTRLDLKLDKGQANYQGTVEEVADELYQGKKSFKIFTIRLERGQTYQIDHISKLFQAFLYLEDADGNLLKENSSAGVGGNSRLVYRAEQTGTYRVIATSLGGFRTGEFVLSVRVINGIGVTLPRGLPSWFKEIDEDKDGQIDLREWLQAGKDISEFREYDLNGDGLITPEEVLRCLKKRLDLELENGQAKFEGTLEQSAEGDYRGKKSFKILTIKLEQGITYQIDHMSKAFDAYLYLEDADGKLLAEDDDGGEGLNSRIIFRAEKTGTYRLIATSLGNTRPGAFSLSVRVLDHFGGNLPRGLPSWFKALDKDGDGQISLHEWLQGGKEIREFSEYDLNGDGLITPDEVLRFLKMRLDLKLVKGQANYEGTIEEVAEEHYRGKKSFKIFTVRLEKGQTYQIDHMSKAFQASLYLEDVDGELLQENSSRAVGENSRITFRAKKSGTYRLIATSQGGTKSGDFLLSVRIINRPGAAAQKNGRDSALPVLFH